MRHDSPPLLGLAFVAVGLALGGGYYAVTDRMQGPRWDRLLPETREKTRALLDRARAAGLDVMFYDGWRPPEASAANISAGTSKLKDPYDSMHVWGAAVDIVFRNALGLPSWPRDDDPRWRQLARIGEAVGFKSGGMMWGWDWPHFQLPDVSMPGLRAAYGRDYVAFLQSRGVAVA